MRVDQLFSNLKLNIYSSESWGCSAIFTPCSLHLLSDQWQWLGDTEQA